MKGVIIKLNDSQLKENLPAQKLIKAFVQFKRLRTEITESPPLEGECLELSHLKHSEMMILFSVNDLEGDYPNGISISDLSANLRVKPPTITPVIRSLEKSGHILRSMDENDRRIIRVSLTEKGNALLDMHKAHFMADIQGLVDYLGPEKSNNLAGLMNEAYEYISSKTKHKKPL